MKSHTPGPWKVGQYLGQSCSWCVHVDVGDKGRGMDIIDYVCGMDAKERLANARLIASAPCLLEALQEVMSWIYNWDPDFTFDNEWDGTEIKARAAIKKATGEE